MLSSEFLIEILFRFTIFSLLLVKIVQLLRSFLIPYLFDEIKKEKAIRTELIEKENFVKSTQNKIENQIKSQNKLLTDLEKNVQRWHASLRRDEEQVGKKFLDIKEKMERKKSILRKNYILATTYSIAITQASELAQQELESFYSNPSNGKCTLNKLIENL
jgi:hypothetical protein